MSQQLGQSSPSRCQTNTAEPIARLTLGLSVAVLGQSGPAAAPAVYRLLGKLNTVPSRTPAEGQRCVMVLRLV